MVIETNLASIILYIPAELAGTVELMSADEGAQTRPILSRATRNSIGLNQQQPHLIRTYTHDRRSKILKEHMRLREKVDSISKLLAVLLKAHVKVEGFGCLSKFTSRNAVNLLISKSVMLCKTMLML